MPIANTNAKRVNKLIEKPITCINAKVPINATGTAKAGISVDLKSCKKINTTMNTSISASNNVFKTSLIEASKNLETS